MKQTTAQKLVNTIISNSDISKLSEDVYTDFGYDIKIYQKHGLTPTQDQYDELFFRISDIIKNNDNAADLLHKSIQPENYTYKKLLGEGFEWVLTGYHLIYPPTWIISSEGRRIVAAYN